MERNAIYNIMSIANPDFCQIFGASKPPWQDVKIGLAAYCATKFALSIINFDPYFVDQARVLQWEVQSRGFLRKCLKGSQMNEVEPWACEVLALYFHAWLQEAKDFKEDFLNNFRRRVFLS